MKRRKDETATQWLRRRPLTSLMVRCRDASTEPPPFGTRFRTCGECWQGFLDYAPGHDAHEVVFGHSPELEARE